MSLTRTLVLIFTGWLCTFSGGVFAQNAWETLPVFHGGRVMPLHTFARTVVRDICGTERPFIVRDDAVIADFNRMIEAHQRLETVDGEPQETAAGHRFWSPGTALDGGFNRPFSRFDQTGGEMEGQQSVLPMPGLAPARMTHIADRIRQLIPAEGRTFSADELLFSWMSEPEVWTYIPIFHVSDRNYLDEVFGESARNSQNRVSVHQLTQSQRYAQRFADVQRRHELGQLSRTPAPFDQITERLARELQAFQELTFHPQRQRPARMLSLLYRTAGLTDESSSYMSAFSFWGYILEFGEVPGRQTTERASPHELTFLHPTTQRWHDVADKMLFLMQIYDRTDSGNPVFPRAVIVEEHYEELITLIDTNFAEAAALMEFLYPGVSYDVSYRAEGDDRAVNIDRLLPRLNSLENQQNQTTLRRAAISYYYSVKRMRKEIEAAYLALYDNGLSLRMLPLQSPLVLELGISENTYGVQPWASAAMIFGSGDTFVRRFFDPQLTASALRTPATGRAGGTLPVPAIEPVGPEPPIPDTINSPLIETFPIEIRAENAIVEEEAETDVPTESADTHAVLPDRALPDSALPDSTLSDHTLPDHTLSDRALPGGTLPNRELLEQLLFSPFDAPDGIIPLQQGGQSFIGDVRISLRGMLNSYTAPVGGRYGSPDFTLRAQDFQRTLRLAAERVETRRQALADEENRIILEHVAKTAYPHAALSKLRAEFRYNRLRPFYWMWVFALAALLLSTAAGVAAHARRKSIDKTILIKSIIQDTMTKERKEQETEYRDYTNTAEEWLLISSVVLLLLSILIAFWGGWMRASISGWAPVTNMYETVVMTAALAAMIGVWFALLPLLHPALRLAWLQSRFPRPGTFLEWLAALKSQKSVLTVRATEGEAAMREAAKEFGIPGGTMIGGQSLSAHCSPEEADARQRVKAAQRKMTGQCLLALPRLLLTCIVFYAVVLFANGDDAASHGFTAAAVNMFATEDIIDWLTVAACVLLLMWFVPHALLALCMMPVILSRPAWIAADLGIRSFETRFGVDTSSQSSEKRPAARPRSEMSTVFHGEEQGAFREPPDTSGRAWLAQARNAVLDRKLLIAITAVIVFKVGLIAWLNRAEFNPDIRPIAAVLRSNFWLAVHVIAIIISYAAAFIAWGMAAVSLGYVIFGRYQRVEPKWKGQKRQFLLPGTCQMCLPVIELLIKIALLLLIIGTVLGARWADYSWGRFWSWDPKEVWALITILFFVIVLHGKIARHYGAIGIFVGALFASIAVIITWYGVNYVFLSSSGRHAYGGGTASNATIFMYVFIAVNLFWGALALLRYGAEVYGGETAEEG